MNVAARSWQAECDAACRLAEERGALQYVATLVARGSSPSVVFEAAASALGGVIQAAYTTIDRREIDQAMSVVALWRAPGTPQIGLPFGGRWTLGDDTPSAAALLSHKPARRASMTMRSDIGDWHRAHRIGHAVACPVIVHDRPWGTMTAFYLGPEPPPDDTEERMGKFVELLSCAITQAEIHAELIVSRSRLVASADATRHRIERDLHDSVQQHLIAHTLQIRETADRLPPEHHELRQRLSDTAQGLSSIITELQQITRGLHPPVLARQGLKAALTELISRCPVPVELHINADRHLPAEYELALYYVVSEALTNVIKHAQAPHVRIDLDQTDSEIRLAIHDNGVGGADPARGSGLVGLTDRIEALGGTLHATSPIGKGTSLLVTIPAPPI